MTVMPCATRRSVAHAPRTSAPTPKLIDQSIIFDRVDGQDAASEDPTMPPPQLGRPVGASGEETRQRLIVATMRCVAKMGHSRATIREIARTAEVTSASLYNILSQQVRIDQGGDRGENGRGAAAAAPSGRAGRR